jgi:hypothetical protein
MLISPLIQPFVQAAAVACLYAQQTPPLRFSECYWVRQKRQYPPLATNSIDFCEHDSALRHEEDCVTAMMSMLLFMA